MSCCKKSPEEIVDSVINANQKNTGIVKQVLYYTKKSVLFIVLAIIFTPFIIPLFLIVLFRMVVLSKKLDLLPIVLLIGKKIFKTADDDEEEEEDEELDGLDEDYELINEDEIIVLNKN